MFTFKNAVIVLIAISVLMFSANNAFSESENEPLIMNNPKPALPIQPPAVAPLPVPPSPLPINLNAKQVIKTARLVISDIKAGGVWCAVTPDGKIEIKAALLYKEAAVAVLHFNPIDGRIMPCGTRIAYPNIPPETAMDKINQIKRNIGFLIKHIRVLNGAEYLEPEEAWAIPISYEGMIISYIKIYSDGIHVIPYYQENIEMKLYSR